MATCSVLSCDTTVRGDYPRCYVHRFETPEKAERENRALGFQELWNQAHEAGRAAGDAHTPEPMLVHDPGTNYHYAPVMSGVCGFASVRISPATTPFVRWLAKQGIGRKAYYGGWEISISAYGQSMEKKEAFARAAAQVLQDAGYKAYASSRMD